MGQAAEAFLAEEQAAWQPFEALIALTDEQLQQPVDAAHGWSGRDLIAHEVAWLADAIEVASELREQPTSPALDRSRRKFAARGDEINAQIQSEWRDLPMGEVRRRVREVREALRDAAAAVPAAHWAADPEHLRFIHTYTVEHYEDHLGDLAALLASVPEAGS